jgi:hypothetical protein
MDPFLGIGYAVSSDALGTLLVYGALTKIMDLTGFRVLLHGYSVIPKPLISIVAPAVPLIEVVSGLSLMFQPLRAAGAALASGFMVAIAGGIWYSLAFGSVPEHCGCFGVGDGDPPSWLTVGRAASLAIVFAVIALLHVGRIAPDLLSLAITVELVILCVIFASTLSSYRRSQVVLTMLQDGARRAQKRVTAGGDDDRGNLAKEVQT